MSRARSYTVATTKQTFGRIVFPIAYKLALYVRQSKGEAVEDNPESFIQQTQGLLRIAIEDLAWPVENILAPFIENQQKKDGTWKSASGTKRIDERQALQELVGYIERGEVKAVLVWLIDRLFRDEDGAEAPAFARICRQHGCRVLTSMGDVFDFSNRRDYKRFLEEAQAGADFITNYLKGRAHPAKRQKALRGEWDGRSVPVGFYVTAKVPRKRFESGTAPRRYLVWEEHAVVVRWIFKRFRELAGDFAALKREVAQKTAEQGYLFPFFPDTMYKPHIALSTNGQGYIISDTGLKDLLCNIAYIGWFYNNGAPPIKDNHPAIVNEGDFWYAFDRLSPVSIDGREQPRERARFTKVGTNPAPALLRGILKADGYCVYVNQYAAKQRSAAYTIVNTKEYFAGEKLGSIAVTDLDNIVTGHLLEKLEAGKKTREQLEPEMWDGWDDLDTMLATRLIDVAKVQESLTAGIDAQLVEYTQEAASLENTLHYGAAALDGKTIEKFSIRLGNLRRSIDQLETKKQRAAERAAELKEFAERLDDVPALWKDMSLEKRRRFVKLVTEKITLTKLAHDWMLVEIAWFWPDVPHSFCYIWQRQVGTAWTDEENRLLRTLYPHADRATILQALPTRSWTAIGRQAFNLQISRPTLPNTSGLYKTLSIRDKEFMDEVGIVFDVASPKKHAWWFTSQTYSVCLLQTCCR
jgi:DNA invertase Pin-like site-specific DNA recombinase